MKMAIVDDDHVFMHTLFTRLKTTFPHIQIDTYNSFHESIYNQNYDCLFLDVMLKDKESFQYGEMILKLHPHMTVIYISSIDHFVYQSYQQNTFFFIRKSHFDEDYKNFIKKYKQLHSPKQYTLTLTMQHMSMTILQQDIIYIESLRNQIIIHSILETYTTYQTLKETYLKLHQDHFYKLNAHTIINLDYVIKVDTKSILLIQDISIPFTRGSKKAFMEKYIQYRISSLWNGS